MPGPEPRPAAPIGLLRRAHLTETSLPSSSGYFLYMTLVPPVEPMQARAVPQPPEPGALPEMVFEPKYDGLRMLVFAQPDGEVFLQSLDGDDLTGSFPEIADAAAALGEDVVIDGEAVIRTSGRLDSGALQQRLNTRPPALARLVRARPAHLVAFDLLQHAGTEMLTWPYRERRAALRSLFQGHGLTAPWALTPSTADRAQAEKWLAESSATGVDGLVIKSLTQPYQLGRRGWLTVRPTDAIGPPHGGGHTRYISTMLVRSRPWQTLRSG